MDLPVVPRGTTIDIDPLNARLRLLATETHVRVSIGRCVAQGRESISVRSATDGFSYWLPEVHPDFNFGPDCCTYVFLNGKVYALGVKKNRLRSILGGEAYVMDITSEQKQWEKLTSMPCPRAHWNRGFAVDGKIYVFGEFEPPIREVVQVYDPAHDTWDLIEIVPGTPWGEVVPGLYDHHRSLARLTPRFKWQDLARMI